MGLGDAAAREATARKKRASGPKPFVWTAAETGKLKAGREILEEDPEYSDDDTGPRFYGARSRKFSSAMGSGVRTYGNEDLTEEASERRERSSRYPKAHNRKRRFTAKEAGDALASS